MTLRADYRQGYLDAILDARHALGQPHRVWCTPRRCSCWQLTLDNLAKEMDR